MGRTYRKLKSKPKVSPRVRRIKKNKKESSLTEELGNFQGVLRRKNV